MPEELLPGVAPQGRSDQPLAPPWLWGPARCGSPSGARVGITLRVREGMRRYAGLGKRGGWMRLLLAGGQLLPELLSYLAAMSGPFKKGNSFAGTETMPGFCSASLRANPLSASPEPGYHVAEHCGLPCFALLCFALVSQTQKLAVVWRGVCAKLFLCPGSCSR